MERKQQVRDLIDEICHDIGPRPAGSPAEAAAARLLEERLEEWGLETEHESFPTTSMALQALLATLAGGYLVAYGLYYLWPPASAAVLCLVLAIVGAHRLLDLDIPALVLPKRQSVNVWGKLKPRGETKQLVLFAGHIDSAYRMPLLNRSDLFEWLGRLAMLLFASFVLLLSLAIWRSLGHGVAGYGAVEVALLVVCTGGAAFAVAMLAGMIRRDAVPGANDNLSAIAAAWEVGRRLAQARPEHTEVWIVGFGSEEPGLKGSREFALRHRSELWRARLVNLESIGQSGKLYVLTGEMLSLAKHSEEAARLVEESAVERGVHLERRYLFHGLTDATSFSRRGLEATCLIRFNDQGFLDHYHTPRDAPESISEEHLEEAVQLCLGVVDQLEQQ